MIEFDRPLNDEEKSLLLALARREHADAKGISHDAATAELGRLVDEGKVAITGNATRAQVFVNDLLRVDTTREWLNFHASNPGNDPMADEIRRTG
jgi:hypothetical protein